MTSAFVTLCTHDAYVPGAMVWASSLRQMATSKDIVILVAPTLSQFSMESLSKVATKLILIDTLDSRDTGNLELLGRVELGVTFSKLYCWCLTEYKKGVFMDADTLVLQNIDELFEREEFSAAPDPGWPDCFNSGVFVFKPSLATFTALMAFAKEKGSFDGGDQGLLNMFFANWSTSNAQFRLPFSYNCVSQAFYSYLPALNYFRTTIKVAHFIGPVKPWHHMRDTATHSIVPVEGTDYQLDFLTKWWAVFEKFVEPIIGTGYLSMSLPSDLTQSVFSPHGGSCAFDSAHGIANLSELDIRSEGGGEGSSLSGADDRQRQYAWERGNIDYTGSDRFSNILGKIEDKMGGPNGSEGVPHPKEDGKGKK